MGNSEFLQNVKELSQQNRKKAASITAQSIKVKINRRFKLDFFIRVRYATYQKKRI